MIFTYLFNSPFSCSRGSVHGCTSSTTTWCLYLVSYGPIAASCFTGHCHNLLLLCPVLSGCPWGQHGPSHICSPEITDSFVYYQRASIQSCVLVARWLMRDASGFTAWPSAEEPLRYTDLNVYETETMVVYSIDFKQTEKKHLKPKLSLFGWPSRPWSLFSV